MKNQLKLFWKHWAVIRFQYLHIFDDVDDYFRESVCVINLLNYIVYILAANDKMRPLSKLMCVSIWKLWRRQCANNEHCSQLYTNDSSLFSQFLSILFLVHPHLNCVREELSTVIWWDCLQNSELHTVIRAAVRMRSQRDWLYLFWLAQYMIDDLLNVLRRHFFFFWIKMSLFLFAVMLMW